MQMNTQNLEISAAVALRQIARNEEIKAYILQNPLLYSALLGTALRFIGGETLPQCLETTLTLNQQGFATTIDYMGESTRDATIAQQATEEFINVVQNITQQTLNSSVSLDLSHIGLAVDADLALENASLIAQAAHSAEIEVMISMEGSERTQQILEIYHQLSEDFNHVGITLQAALHRTPADLAEVLKQPGRIRLVKGAYAESADVAKPRGAAVDSAYQELMETLLASGHRCSIATHDPQLLNHRKPPRNPAVLGQGGELIWQSARF